MARKWLGKRTSYGTSDDAVPVGPAADGVAEGDAVEFELSAVESFWVSYHFGNGAMEEGDNRAAVENYDRAVEMWEETCRRNQTEIPEQMVAMCLTNRGTALTRLGALDDAIGSFDRSIGAHPSFVMAHYNKAWLLEQSGRVVEAAAAWEAYLEAAGDRASERESVAYAREHLSHSPPRARSLSSEGLWAFSCPHCGREYRIGIDASIMTIEGTVEMMISSGTTIQGTLASDQRDDMLFSIKGVVPERLAQLQQEAKETAQYIRRALARGEAREWYCKECGPEKGTYPYSSAM